MAKYAKPKRRTEKKGLRESTLDNFPFSKVQRWKEKLQEILTNNFVLDEKCQFLLEYSLKVCQFRLALLNSKDAQPFFREIDRKVDKAHSLGFSQEDIWAINRVFRDQEKGELEKNFETLQTRAGAK